MLQIRRNAYQQVLEFDRGRIIIYRKRGISFHGIAVALVDIQPLSCEYGIKILLRFKLNGMQDLHPMTNAREARHIMRLAVRNVTTTSWTGNEHVCSMPNID
ncbi:hypothetical protein TNCV_5074641 [Trichonephila clavipes]|nr:hypothetical protein TNCV_5074641 [Trichonephila clavipes]